MTLDHIAQQLRKIEELTTWHGRPQDILDKCWEEIAQLRLDIEIADRREWEARNATETAGVALETTSPQPLPPSSPSRRRPRSRRRAQ